MGRIVVGVDGSHGSIEALRFAVEEARCHGHEVVAVSVFQYTTLGVPLVPEAMPMQHATVEDVRARTEDALAKIVAEVVTDPEVQVTQLVREGPTARAILDAAADADLIVVGSRGLGGFRGLLLGSVSHQVVTHATCPVVVMPHAETD